jgi:unsaturated rhamnogalacturonyl hydrolase
MKRFILIGICFAWSLAQGMAAPPLFTLSISNPSGINREGEVLEIPYGQISGRLGQTKDFKLINLKTGKEIPYQLAYLGQAQPQQLLLLISLAAGQSVTVTAIPGRPAAFKARAYGRYVPERKDDFAWENDRVAFRMYGKALENYPKENAHGIDVWSKRTSDLVIDTWYKLDNYHHDNGQGLDYYKVGMTLGAGDIAPCIGDSIYYSRNYRSQKVLDNGPLRTTFQLGYEEWQAGDVQVSVTKTISLDAGSQLNRMQVQYSIRQGGRLPVAAGIVKREEPGVLLLDEQQGVLGYWEPQHGEDGTMGVGCVFPAEAGLPAMSTDREHLLNKATVTNQQPFVYYFGAAWSKAGQVRNAAQWFAYLERFAQELKQPLQVKLQ